MLFSRRDRQKLGSRLRAAIWPRSGWRRALVYHWHRLARISETPRRIAMGVACGVFISFTPVLGLHMVLAALLAILLKGSVLASAAGTLIGNPVSFPLIWLSSYKLGTLILGTVPRTHHVIVWPPDASMAPGALYAGTWTELWELLEPIILPMSVGGVVLGLGFAVASYYIVYFAVEAYRQRRRQLRANGATSIARRQIFEGDAYREGSE